jgi:hypothetical protein
MKCFVSGRSSNFDEVVRVTQLLRDHGHEITHDWTVLPMVKPYHEHTVEAGKYAELQLSGIAAADVCIFLAHYDGTGLFAELGAALMHFQKHAKPKIYAVANEIPEAMFHYHPAIHWKKDIEAVLLDLHG